MAKPYSLEAAYPLYKTIVESVDPQQYIQSRIIPDMDSRAKRVEPLNNQQVTDRYLSINPHKPGEIIEYFNQRLVAPRRLTPDLALELADLVYYSLQPNAGEMFRDITPVSQAAKATVRELQQMAVIKYLTRIDYGDDPEYKSIERRIMEQHFADNDLYELSYNYFMDTPIRVTPDLLTQHGHLLYRLQKQVTAGTVTGSVGIIAVRPTQSTITQIPLPSIDIGIDMSILSQDLLMIYDISRNSWGNPAGHIESYDPTIWDAVAREAKEESGLTPQDFILTELIDLSLERKVKAQSVARCMILFKAEVNPAFRPSIIDIEDIGQAEWHSTLSALDLVNARQEGGISYGEKYTYGYIKGNKIPLQRRLELFQQRLHTLETEHLI